MVGREVAGSDGMRLTIPAPGSSSRAGPLNTP
jgi:hypothetical protein